MSMLRFVIWNVRGIGSREKRLKIFKQLKELQADIVLMQETHLSDKTNTLASPQFPHVFSASYNSKQRGLAILMHKIINFTNINSITDPEGRFIIVSLSIHNRDICIVSLYGPNKAGPSFFHSFFSALSDYSDTALIIGFQFSV